MGGAEERKEKIKITHHPPPRGTTAHFLPTLSIYIFNTVEIILYNQFCILLFRNVNLKVKHPRTPAISSTLQMPQKCIGILKKLILQISPLHFPSHHVGFAAEYT